MPKIATLLYGPALVATGPTTVQAASATQIDVIRFIHVSNPTGSAATFTMSIGADAAGTRIYGAYSIAAGSNLETFCYYPINNVLVSVSSGTNNVLVLTYSGDRYTLG